MNAYLADDTAVDASDAFLARPSRAFGSVMMPPLSPGLVAFPELDADAGFDYVAGKARSVISPRNPPSCPPSNPTNPGPSASASQETVPR